MVNEVLFEIVESFALVTRIAFPIVTGIPTQRASRGVTRPYESRLVIGFAVVGIEYCDQLLDRVFNAPTELRGQFDDPDESLAGNFHACHFEPPLSERGKGFARVAELLTQEIPPSNP